MKGATAEPSATTMTVAIKRSRTTTGAIQNRLRDTMNRRMSRIVDVFAIDLRMPTSSACRPRPSILPFVSFGHALVGAAVVLRARAVGRLLLPVRRRLSIEPALERIAADQSQEQRNRRQHDEKYRRQQHARVEPAHDRADLHPDPLDQIESGWRDQREYDQDRRRRREDLEAVIEPV